MSDWQSVRALLGGIPALPGARCAGRWDTSTADRPSSTGSTSQLARDELESARTTALRLCETMPGAAALPRLSARPADRAPSGQASSPDR